MGCIFAKETFEIYIDNSFNSHICTGKCVVRAFDKESNLILEKRIKLRSLDIIYIYPETTTIAIYKSNGFLIQTFKGPFVKNEVYKIPSLSQRQI